MGRFVRGSPHGIRGLKKDKGFGAEYGPIRNGDGSIFPTRPTEAFARAAAGRVRLCHMQATSAALSNNLPPINAKNDT